MSRIVEAVLSRFVLYQKIISWNYLTPMFCYNSEIIMTQCMRFWYLSHKRAANAQASLRICTDSPEPSLLAHTKYGCRLRLRTNFRPLALLDTSARAFIKVICAYAISTEISCSGPHSIGWTIYSCTKIIRA